MSKDSQTPVKTKLKEQHLLVRDLTFSCHIGLTDEERARPQRLRVNLDLTLAPKAVNNDEIDETVNYGTLVRHVRTACVESNVRLLETLADLITQACFFHDQIQTARIRIEKLDRYPDVAGVGIEVVRERA